jgi:hypothetical protein
LDLPQVSFLCRRQRPDPEGRSHGIVYDEWSGNFFGGIALAALIAGPDRWEERRIGLEDSTHGKLGTSSKAKFNHDPRLRSS